VGTRWRWSATRESAGTICPNRQIWYVSFAMQGVWSYRFNHIGCDDTKESTRPIFSAVRIVSNFHWKMSLLPSKIRPGLPGVLRHSVKLLTYPRIHRWASVSRRAVGPRWHDDVANKIVYMHIYNNVLFLEARLEICRPTTGRALFIYNVWVLTGSNWMPAREAVIALIWGRCLRRCSG
jgi:hypothetical protein